MLISAAFDMLLFGEVHRHMDKSCLATSKENLKKGIGIVLIK
ncbi:hypothetical protein PEC301879_31220 [Pectobacterium carotovorum subsp. carotovorum]|nr:hypothetical protein PEC301879_31220 [Pectobacterium carotovorum subsp. carotovorum]